MNILNRTIKQAYAILRAHKVLWAMGLFLFWNMGFMLFAYNPLSLKIQGQVWEWFGLGIVLALLMILYLRGRATIVLYANNVLDKQYVTFWKQFGESRKYWPRLFLLFLIVMVLLALLVGILATPVVYLWANNLHTRASILGIFGGLVFLPFAVMLLLLNNIAPLFIIILGLSVANAIRASLDMIRKNWSLLLVFSLLLELFVSFGAYLVLLFWRVGVVIFGQILYNNGGFQTNLASIAFVILLSAIFLILASIIGAYQQIAWTIMFREMVRPQKTDEPEALPVPEII